jgi:parallel beta-helix repeat protein
MRKHVRACVALALFAALQATTADAKAADPAPTPVSITCSNQLGLVIAQPGRYRLMRSVTNCASESAIEITAPDVVLDLDGRTINGDDDALGGLTGIYIKASRATVKNGVISDFTWGIEIQNAAGSKVSGLSLKTTAQPIQVVSASPGTRIADNTITVGAPAIEASDGATVSGNSITGGNIVVDDSVVKNNVVVGGSVTATDGSLVSGNTVAASGNDGISLNSGSIAELNHVSWSTGAGIKGDGLGGVIRSNTVVGNAANGIHLVSSATQTKIKGNTVKNNTGDGIIHQGAKARIANNVVTGNSGVGIDVASDHKIADNKVTGNGANGILGGFDLTITGNTVKGNGADGINAVGRLTILRNKANGNSANGIVISSPNAQTTVNDNVANENALYGIKAGGFEVPHSGNTASGNGESAQCDPTALCN